MFTKLSIFLRCWGPGAKVVECLSL